MSLNGSGSMKEICCPTTCERLSGRQRRWLKPSRTPPRDEINNPFLKLARPEDDGNECTHKFHRWESKRDRHTNPCDQARAVEYSGNSIFRRRNFSDPCSVLLSREVIMQGFLASRTRLNALGRFLRAADTTVFPLAMIVVLTVVLVLLMMAAAHS